MNRDRYSAYPSMFSSRRIVAIFLLRFPFRELVAQQGSPLLK